MANPAPGRGRCRVQAFLHELWSTVQEPKEVTVLQFCIYLAALIGGALTLLYPPTSIYGVMGSPAIQIWGVLLTGGGAFGTFSILSGVWWTERAALIALFTSMAMYWLTVLNLQLETPGSRFSQLTVIMMVALYHVTRWAAIRKYPRDPERATRREWRRAGREGDPWTLG